MILLKVVFFIAIITVCLSLMFATDIYEYFFPNKTIDPELSQECETALFCESEPKTNDHSIMDEK